MINLPECNLVSYYRIIDAYGQTWYIDGDALVAAPRVSAEAMAGERWN